MDAIQITHIGHSQTCDLQKPMPKGDEVLIRVGTAGLCHTDIDILKGNYAGEYPVVPGHEFSGQVIATGENVTSIKNGDRVAIDPLLPCQTCEQCQKGNVNLCEHFKAYGLTSPGGFAEYVAINESNCHPIGDMPYEVASLAEPFSCVFHSVDRLQLLAGDSAIVFGAGPMGLMMTLALKHRGVGHLVMVDPNTSRLENALTMGADEAIAAPDDRQFDLVIDCSGAPQVCEHLTDLAKNGGKVLFFGVCDPKVTVAVSPYDIFRKELTLLGSHSLRGNLADSLSFLDKNRESALKLVTHRISLKEMQDLLTTPAHDGRMKTQVVFDE
ncbi:zinc-binding dehydrogenase (plasmid) [Vibrio nigripulchritudo]|uniref:zinc-dependent alcohol dehydrogenase family protein n=1 Tax=Vibrio nigripulchritudo TaxID=28173 RepID=UPI00190DD461|nr:zinc-dependent alcohol dehydrogenase family protein [Vibrio nigripulchritudo]BCL73650.1 zinc-binding dehydrogenase [Vibrio nigripulchritudo]BDU35019.1 zinc-binding dehydrogenase [Vibrio nigripulchritudo]